MRRPGTSPVKTEGDRISVSLPKSCADIKSERTHGCTGEKPILLSKSLVTQCLKFTVSEIPILAKKRIDVFLCRSVGLERVKTELREEASGLSSVSDVDSDSDSPTEVNPLYLQLLLLYEGDPCVLLTS